MKRLLLLFFLPACSLWPADGYFKLERIDLQKAAQNYNGPDGVTSYDIKKNGPAVISEQRLLTRSVGNPQLGELEILVKATVDFPEYIIPGEPVSGLEANFSYDTLKNTLDYSIDRNSMYLAAYRLDFLMMWHLTIAQKKAGRRFSLIAARVTAIKPRTAGS